MSEELKPCPLCDREAKLTCYGPSRSGTLFLVSCVGCGLSLPWRDNEDEIKAAWNRRRNNGQALGFPKHEGELCIRHNEHKVVHSSVRNWLDEKSIEPGEAGGIDELEELCAGDELWEIEWYPENAVGFYRVFAATLDHALELANEMKS